MPFTEENTKETISDNSSFPDPKPLCKLGLQLSHPKRRMFPIKKTMRKKKLPAKPIVMYSCKICSFQTTNILKHHAHKHQHQHHEVKEQNVNIFKCHNCSYSCKIKGGLQRHIKRVHTKERPFTCPVCIYRAIDKSSIAQHVLKKHQENFGNDVNMYINCMRAGNQPIDSENDGCSFNDSRNDINNPSDEKLKLNDELNGCNKSLPLSKNQEDIFENQAAETQNVIDKMENRENSSDIEIDMANVGREDIEPVIKRTEQKNEFNPEKNMFKNDTGHSENFHTPRIKAKLNCIKNESCSGTRTTNPKVTDEQVTFKCSKYYTTEYREMRNRKLTCQYCNKLCGSQRELFAHKNEHKGSGVHCPICHSFIVDAIERMAHIENHFNENMPFKCATCLSTFLLESEVVYHQQREHRKTINVIMECMYCPFSSRSLERFTRHMTRTHILAANIALHNPFNVDRIKTLVAEMKLHPNKDLKDIKYGKYRRDDAKLETSGNESNFIFVKGEMQEEGNESHFNYQTKLVNGKDSDNENVFDYSLLGMSGEIDESIESFQKYLENDGQLHGLGTSEENIDVDGDTVNVENDRNCSDDNDLHLSQYDDNSGNESSQQCDNNNQISSPIHDSHISWMSRNSNPLVLTNDISTNCHASTQVKQTILKSLMKETISKNAEIVCRGTSGSGTDYCNIAVTDSGSSNYSNHDEVSSYLKNSTSDSESINRHHAVSSVLPMFPHPTTDALATLSLNHSCISSIASEVKNSSISAMDVHKIASRQSCAQNRRRKMFKAKRRVTQAICASPDSTSGTK